MLSQLRSLWRALSGRRRFEQELADELRFHLESRTADLLREGLLPEEAHRRARIELGAVESHKDEARAARGLRFFEEAIADGAFALRSWPRQRGLALAVIATLTLGIGLSTAWFTLINAFLFRVYGVPDPGTFARVFIARAVAPETPDDFEDPSGDDVAAVIAEGVKSLSPLVAAKGVSASFGDDPSGVSAQLVTCNFFAFNGPLPPLRGRLLDARDCAGRERVLVLSEAFWRARFGGDSGVVGRVVSYGGRSFRIVGVAPAAFSGRMRKGSFWLPYTLASDFAPAPQPWMERWNMVGRLDDGRTLRQVEAELQVLFAQRDGQHPGQRTQVLVTNGSLIQEPKPLAGKILIVSLLLGALSIIVVLAAVNVVTLLLSRAHARRHEIAVRLALGASSGRLVKMLLTEIIPLAAIAAGASLLVAYNMAPLFYRWVAPESIALDLSLDWRVWCFLLVVTLLAAAIAGLTPALEAMNVHLVESLKGRTRAMGAARRRLPLRDVLVAAQITFSLVLLVSAGLVVRSHARMPLEEAPFETRQTFFAKLSPGSQAAVSWPAAHLALATELGQVPGVLNVAFARHRPPGGERWEVRTEAGSWTRAEANDVSATFFDALGLRILHGRALNAADAGAVVLSERLARKLWPGASPLGQTLLTAAGQRHRVVGVAADAVEPGTSEGLTVYRPLRPGGDTLLVRFAGAPGAAAAGIRAAMARATPELGRPHLRTFHERLQHQAAELKPAIGFTIGLGLVALILAVVGVHGVVSFAARRQLKELGIRIALGARRWDVVMALLRPTARSLGIGLVAGLLITCLGVPALAFAVQEMDALDPWPYAGAALLLTGAAFVAMVRPIRWALAVDPAVVLRDD